MATNRAFTLFDELEIFRPARVGAPITTKDSELITAPAGSTVQIRFDERALNVWFTDEARDYYYSFTLKHPRITSFGETDLAFEGFEANERGEVAPVAVKVHLSHSRLRTA